jgi:hypothetical protein
MSGFHYHQVQFQSRPGNTRAALFFDLNADGTAKFIGICRVFFTVTGCILAAPDNVKLIASIGQ